MLLALAGTTLGLLTVTAALADGGQAVGDFRVYLPGISRDAPQAVVSTPTPASPTATIATTTAIMPAGPINATPTASGRSAPPGLMITSLTSPIKRGLTASLTAQTAPSASCSLSYVTPGGTISSAQGLGAATANAAGVVTWSWTVGASTGPGAGTVTVECGASPVSVPIVITA
jgi:hypothetical protein